MGKHRPSIPPLSDNEVGLVKAMARTGLGWEDIVVRLQLPWWTRHEVRSIVLKKKVHLLRMAVGK
jgi:hypothetical protein